MTAAQWASVPLLPAYVKVAESYTSPLAAHVASQLAPGVPASQQKPPTILPGQTKVFTKESTQKSTLSSRLAAVPEQPPAPSAFVIAAANLSSAFVRHSGSTGRLFKRA